MGVLPLLRVRCWSFADGRPWRAALPDRTSAPSSFGSAGDLRRGGENFLGIQAVFLSEARRLAANERGVDVELLRIAAVLPQGPEDEGDRPGLATVEGVVELELGSIDEDP